MLVVRSVIFDEYRAYGVAGDITRLLFMRIQDVLV
jgi:hypothetical protein